MSRRAETRPPLISPIRDNAALSALIESLRTRERYAIDTEFKRERTYYPELCLVQLAWEDERGEIHSALIDTLATDPTLLAPLLKSPAQAVLHAGSQDLEIFRDCCGALPSSLIDTQRDLAFLGYTQLGLGPAIREILGIEVEKSSQLIDWARRPLDEISLRYAQSDVTHLLQLSDAIAEKLRARGRLQWARERSADDLVHAASARDPRTLWWKLKGVTKFRTPQRKIAQAVTAWRESEAQRINRPVKSVLSELSILAIASRPPRDARELAKTRGIEQGRVNRDRLLAAIEEGRAMPDEALHSPPMKKRAHAPKGAITLLSAYLDEIAAREEISKPLLATTADVEEFVRDRSGPLSRGWRFSLVGDALAALLDGERAICLEDGSLRLVALPAR